MHLTTYLCFILFICQRTLSFNIETRRFITHIGPKDSKFGFSLAHHQDSEGKWVIVGAPEAETYIRGVTKGGAVYQCSVTGPNECQSIPFDTKGNHHDGTQFRDDKSHQWFGATVASRSGVIAACAPRYVWFSVKKNRREPIGGCFLLTNDRGGTGRFKTYSPCMTTSWGYHRQGTCQAGFGIALAQGGGKVYVGAVGSWYWQGQIFYQNLLNMQEKLTTSEAPKEFDMSYMGFCIAMGNFDDDAEEDIAVGVPRGDGLKGKVVLFDNKLNVLYNISGQQVGSYFGYSIAILDVDGDGRDDVAVGAPWHSLKDQPLYEEGMVSVFRQTKQHNFQSLANIAGRRSRAHFGLSLASLKDLNGDGYDDLAVGAPGDGEEGGGGVYIFMGSAEGIREEPTQIIFIEKLTNEPVKTFGWALTAGSDIDKNYYPDLVVGAHESNRVYVFRTRPVVEIEASVKFRSSTGVFDLESLDCSLLDGTSVSCYPIRICISYSGLGVPPSLDFVSNLRLDTSYTDYTSRLFFLKHERKYTYNQTFSLKKNIQTCVSLHIYAEPNVPDKLTPLVAELKVSVAEPEETSDPLLVDPILSPRPFGNNSAVKDTIYFQNNCGVDNICIPDLKLEISSNLTKYVIGSPSTIPFELNVTNDGEDAYTSKIIVQTPQGIHFSKFTVLHNGAPEDVTPFCTRNVLKNRRKEISDVEETQNSLEYVVCEIGNPLPSESGVGILLYFQPNPNVTIIEPLAFYFNVNSTNKENNETILDNSVFFSLPATMESDISMRGVSWPDGEFFYNSSIFGASLLGQDQSVTHEREIGPQVVHIYDVLNRGPSDLPRVEIYLLWPTRTLLGDPLLYLVDTPTVSSSSPMQCDPVPDVNYLNLLTESPEELPLTATSLLTSNASWFSSSSRHSREAVADEPIYLFSEEKLSQNSLKSQSRGVQLSDLLSCGSTNCTIMKCSKDILRNKEHFIVKVRSRLWTDTIDTLGIANIKISSRLVVHSYLNSNNTLTWSESVVTSAVQTGTKKVGHSLSRLIWLGSIVIGLLVLALLILLLWLLGFFERRRPQDESENELLQSQPEQNGIVT